MGPPPGFPVGPLLVFPGGYPGGGPLPGFLGGPLGAPGDPGGPLGFLEGPLRGPEGDPGAPLPRVGLRSLVIRRVHAEVRRGLEERERK